MANYILGTLPNFLYPGPNCAIAGSLPNFTGEIAGDQHLDTISGTLPNFEGAIVGNTGRFAAISGSLPNFEGNIIAMSGGKGALSGALPNFKGSITAIPHKIAVISGTLPNFTGSIAAHFINVGQIVGTLPNFSGSIISLGTFHTISVNPALRGVTEYSNYSFDSFFEFGGSYYGVNAMGIYLLTGSTDAGTAISAYFDSGDVEYAGGQRSKITDVHALGRTNSSIRLTLYEDDGTGNTYSSIGDTSGKQQNHRFKPAKGAEGVKWRYRMANVAGGTMEIQQLNLLIAEMSRKR